MHLGGGGLLRLPVVAGAALYGRDPVIPVTQSRAGERGTCFRACLASILNLPERAVTDFDKGEGGLDGYWGRVHDWLAERGLRYRRVPVDGAKPSGWSTIEGVSPRGGLHACVAYDGELVHDPHPRDGTGRGLTEPRYYGLLEPIKGKGRDAQPTKFGKKCAKCGTPLQNEMKVLTCQACRYEAHQKARNKPVDTEYAERIRAALRRHGADRADMLALRRNTERQGGPFFIQETMEGGAERTVPVRRLNKAADAGTGKAWHRLYGSMTDPDAVRGKAKNPGPVPGTREKHEPGWTSAACHKNSHATCSSLSCACPCHRRGAKDASPVSVALLLAALLVWYRARKAECGAQQEYDLARYVPKRRAFDAPSSGQLNRYPMSRLLDALGIDIKEYMRRDEAQKTALLRTAIEKLDKGE